MDDAALLETLPAPARLALAYAPRAARREWLTWLAFDARLARIVRQAREPLLCQMRLAWWRDRLGEEPLQWPTGEPLLAALRDWRGDLATLVAVVDAWELLLAEASDAAVADLAVSRAAALVVLAGRLGVGHAAETVRQAGSSWALTELTQTAPLAHPRLPRAMRPLAVLLALARRPEGGAAALFATLRAGLFGR